MEGDKIVERTFIMIKPDGVQRGLIGEIISRFEKKGLKLLASKFLQLSLEQAEQHYSEHVGKSFYEPLLQFITSGPVMAMVWSGENAIELSRALIGKTNPLQAYPGTIRSDYAVHTKLNLIHGSDSIDNAEREIAIYFNESEIVQYTLTLEQWI